MRVNLKPLEGTQIDRMVVVEPQSADVHDGEVVGYMCSECWQADETRQQIWHDEDCSLCGVHGREFYDEIEPDNDIRPTPEFNPEHKLTVIKAAESSGRDRPCENEVVAFRCSCGNADEDLFEIVHDEACALADADREEILGWDESGNTTKMGTNSKWRAKQSTSS